ncbi:MAG: transposase, partial [Burkholderiales bacterium]|nr:transposase [Burkholderiales bacterium]
MVGIDSSFVLVPIQRNTPEENDIIKAGKGDTLWTDNPHKKAHKDINAMWTTKGDVDYYGYKCHGVVCLRTKLIVNMKVTAANVHDSVVAPELIRCLTPHPENIRSYGVAKGSPGFFADAGYKSKKIEDEIAAMGCDGHITERRWR